MTKQNNFPPESHGNIVNDIASFMTTHTTLAITVSSHYV